MDLFFDDVSGAFRENRITGEHIAGWMDVLGLQGEERETRWDRLHGGEGGTLVQFQVVALHRAAKEQDAERRANGDLMDAAPAVEGVAAPPAGAAPTTESGIPIPAALLRDVPEPVYDEPLPDLAAAIKAKLGIIAAVRMFGKHQERIRDASVEGVKIRCPYNDHNDSHPSAWCNTEKNTWYCGVCTVGGDVIDFFAARKHGLRPADFHRSTKFSEVVKEMGAEMGMAVVRKGRNFVIEDEEAPLPSPLPDAPVGGEPTPARSVPVEADSRTEDSPDAATTPEPVVPPSPEAAEPITVTVDDTLRGISLDADVLDGLGPDDDDDFEDDLTDIPGVEWRELPINPGSFLGEWMQYAEKYYPWVPPEYFLFAGIQGIGLALGHNVTSFTGSKLTGSTMMALIGSSASGKSTAVSELTEMLRRIPGPKFEKDFGTGVKQIPSPASSEALLTSIKTEIEDIGSVIPGAKREVGVTAWLYEDEFATFMERARRRGGGTLKTRLIQLHDFKKKLTTPEVVIEEYALTSGTRVLHDTYFSAMFTTQTDAIRGLMERTDLISGFLNRIIPVMGVRRERRRVSGMLATPANPVHDDAYKHMWDRCRSGTTTIPFTDAALDLVDNHPFLHHVDRLASTDSLYSRVQHMTVRLALLLAVNNAEREVSERYVAAVCDLFSNYLMACFRRLRGAVITTDMDDASNRIHHFVRSFYKKHNVWPTVRQWSKDRSYSDFDAVTRQKALESMFYEFRLVRIKLAKGKTGPAAQVLLIPDGEWVAYAESHDKKYNYDDFYAKAE